MKLTPYGWHANLIFPFRRVELALLAIIGSKNTFIIDESIAIPVQFIHVDVRRDPFYLDTLVRIQPRWIRGVDTTARPWESGWLTGLGR